MVDLKATEELDEIPLPTLDEIKTVIEWLKENKSPGLVVIPAESQYNTSIQERSQEGAQKLPGNPRTQCCI